MMTPLHYQDTCTLPPGFRAAGVHAGIKADPEKLDMALLISDEPETVVAGMFTTNKVQAAPVQRGIQQMKTGHARAVVINSGNANACTGEQGVRDMLEMAERTAKALGVGPNEVVVSSTGSIGKPLNMVPVRNGIDLLVPGLSAEAGDQAATAIMTTDTRPKACTTSFEVNGARITLAGICKGAGMIEPNMATMLAYVCTDANISPDHLRAALAEAVNASFNKISIDGDTSTNDSVVCLANGRSGVELAPGSEGWDLFQTALNGVMFDLAMKIVWDGEGMTKFIELRAKGAVSDKEADQALRAIANSFLVKTGWAGTYPAWTRIVDVLGYCGVDIDPDNLGVWYDDLALLENSTPALPDPAALNHIVTSNRFIVTVDLGKNGLGEAVLYTCDSTEEYVRINMF
jgi:glutamate N-acetyltransferase/amino-acid N-acetyltransferase